jgi:DNA (cytosine-5)-methyltransferase 1
MHCITEEQREYLMTLPLRKRQKEILKEEYLNGEWYERDIRAIRDMPKADCWTFGAPCQDFSFAGKRAGLDGDRSTLVREVFTLLEKRREEDRPEWLIYENVKGMLSTNGGFDYLEIITEMDRLGYDCEWQNINSAWYVPQNRERIYTIGHLRARGRQQILPIAVAGGENPVRLIGHRDGYRRNSQVFSADGCAEALDTAQGGGRGHHTAVFIDIGKNGGVKSPRKQGVWRLETIKDSQTGVLK